MRDEHQNTPIPSGKNRPGNILAGILRFILSILAPFILIAAGAGIVALGFMTSWIWLVYTGAVVAGIGVLWIIIWMNGDGGFGFGD